MLRGIDVSNWQAGLVPSKLDIDFCIAKATEGDFFVDKYCDGFIQNCIANGILFGYYHFAGNGNPETEAKWLWNHTLGYSGHGIPVLDYESWQFSRDHVKWCQRFMNQYQKLSGIWPVLYISASHCSDFNASWIPDKCGLWVAGYNRDYSTWPKRDDMPYDVSPWPFAAMWQFASDFSIDGSGYALDADIAFMDAAAWMKYAGSKSASTAPAKKKLDKTCEQLADEVIAGKWGNGWNRRNALDSAYGTGTYEHVQAIVDEKLGLDGC